MGMVGTAPAAGRVLLVGDAAGLVNPLQGEGIAQAMQSGRWAAEAILGWGGAAADHYRARLAAAHLPYQRIAAALQQALMGRPRAAAVLARSLTLAGQVEPLAGGWAVFWNELLDGAPRGRHRVVAAAATRIGARPDGVHGDRPVVGERLPGRRVPASGPARDGDAANWPPVSPEPGPS